MTTELNPKTAKVLAGHLRDAYLALENYREATKIMRLGSDGWGRPAYCDLGAYQIFADLAEVGELGDLTALEAFAKALEAGASFEDGNDGYEYDVQRDAVRDWLEEADLLVDDDEEEEES